MIKFISNSYNLSSDSYNLSSDKVGDVFKNLIAQTQESIQIISPFLSFSPVVEVLKQRTDIQLFVLTKFTAEDVFYNPSHIDVLEIFSDLNAVTKTINNLHSKIYVFDYKKIIIGSSNFTDKGFYSNQESNILIDLEEFPIEGIENYIKKLWDKAYNFDVKKEQLRDLKSKITQIKNISKDEIKQIQQEFDKIFAKNTICKDLSTWLCDVYKIIRTLNQPFDIKDIYKYENELKKLHPYNNFIKEKIRQVLQDLRKRGYIENLSRGKYRLIK